MLIGILIVSRDLLDMCLGIRLNEVRLNMSRGRILFCYSIFFKHKLFLRKKIKRKREVQGCSLYSLFVDGDAWCFVTMVCFSCSPFSSILSYLFNINKKSLSNGQFGILLNIQLYYPPDPVVSSLDLC